MLLSRLGTHSLCCSSVAALLHICCSSVAALLCCSLGPALYWPLAASALCKRAATELQQSCNRAATELQQSCNRAATVNSLYLRLLQQNCNRTATVRLFTGSERGTLCNRAATELQQSCNRAHGVFSSAHTHSMLTALGSGLTGSFTDIDLIFFFTGIASRPISGSSSSALLAITGTLIAS
jgi:hypothetical protein